MLQLSYIVHVNPIQITVSKDLQPEIKIDLCTSHKCKAMKTLALLHTLQLYCILNKIRMFSTIIMNGLLTQFFQNCFAFKKPSFSSA